MKPDVSEKEILDSVEKGEWRSVGRLKEEKRRYIGYAASTFRKDRRVNIRLIHKFVSGRLRGF